MIDWPFGEGEFSLLAHTIVTTVIVLLRDLKNVDFTNYDLQNVLYIHDEFKIYEPLCDKTNNLALRPGPTQRDVQRQNKAKKLKSSDLESRGIVLSV